VTFNLVNGDCLEVLKTLSDASVDAVVTDPPYELGFMGKGWDASGIAYNVDLWRECLRVLKPGGHLLAFGGTRTYHRMAVAIEDAGFEIRDSLHWIYGSGFPKSRNLDGEWSGWGTALKPAHEPVVVARKPLVGTVAANVLAHGTGALNIDGCRVAGVMDGHWGGKQNSSIGFGGTTPTGFQSSAHTAGRWPPNILLSHTPECAETCAEDCAVVEMDRQSGMAKPKPARKGRRGGTAWQGRSGLGSPDGIGAWPEDAGGGASRFFPVFRYQAKASRSEREIGCKDLPEVVARSGMGGTMPIDDNGNARDRFSVKAKNHHPTVKPVALMAWLVKLVTPPGGTVLDPFMGSGTTGVAATQEGFGFIGIEREPEYFRICKARVASAVPAQPEQKELFG